MADRAEYFAQIHNGDIHGIVQANPPHELTENQIALTKEEFWFLKSVKALQEATKLVHDVKHKITLSTFKEQKP